MKKQTTVGQMREVIGIERPTNTPDGYGGQATVWSVVYNLYARARAVQGKEDISGDRRVTVERYLFVTRYGVTINTTDRLQWNGSYWNITSVQDVEGKRRYLTIEAERGYGST